jgi:hypothetical protein
MCCHAFVSKVAKFLRKERSRAWVSSPRLANHMRAAANIVKCIYSVYIILVGKPEGKRSLGRPRRRWEGNIEMYLQEVGGGFGEWMELAQDRDRWGALVITVKNLRVP